MDPMLPWIWLSGLFGVATFWFGHRVGAGRGLRRGQELGYATGYLAAVRTHATVLGNAMRSQLLSVPDLADLAGPVVTAEAVRYVLEQERERRKDWPLLGFSGPPPAAAWIARDPDAAPRTALGGLLEICRELLEGNIDRATFRAELLRRGPRPTAFLGGPGSGIAACLGSFGTLAVGHSIPGDEPTIGRICDEFLRSATPSDPSEFMSRLVHRIAELAVEEHVAHRLEQLSNPVIVAKVWRGPGTAPRIW